MSNKISIATTVSTAAFSILFLGGARQYLMKPKVVGTRDHDGVSIQVQKDNYLVADHVTVQIQDYRWKDRSDIVQKHEWSFRPIVLDGDVLHSFA